MSDETQASDPATADGQDPAAAVGQDPGGGVGHASGPQAAPDAAAAGLSGSDWPHGQAAASHDDARAHEWAASAVTATASERPELIVAAAFAAGVVLALILKRLAR